MGMQIHFSIDDVINSLRWLSRNNPNSIFDMDIYSTLKRWNEIYGIKVTCYIFENDANGFHIGEIPKKYIEELAENSNWLKFAYHGINDSYNNIFSNDDFEKQFLQIKEKFRQESLASTIRIHRWKLSVDEINFLCENGVHSFLGTDDKERMAYDLSMNEIEELWNYGKIERNNRFYIKTDIRYDNLNDIYEVIPLIEKERLVIFGHENYFLRKKDLLEELWNMLFYKKITFWN